MNTTKKIATVLLGIMLGVMGVSGLYAQSNFIVSNRADFSEHRQTFAPEDTLYIKVQDEQIDALSVKENTYELEARDSDAEHRGHLKNHLNGTWTAAIPLSGLANQASSWKLSVEIEDDRDNVFKGKLMITIGDAGTPVTPAVEHKVMGSLDSLGTDFLLLGPVQIFVDSSTVYRGEDGSQRSFAHLAAGQKLEISAYADSTGRLFARKVYIEDQGSNHEKRSLELKTTIQEAGDGYIIVANTRLNLSSEASVRNENGEHMAVQDLQAGTFVEIVVRYDNGEWLVKSIEVNDRHGHDSGKHDDDDRDSIEIAGRIQAKEGDGTITVRGHVITVTDSTRIEGSEDSALTYADLVVGMYVEVKAWYNSDSTLVAVEIEAETHDREDDIELTARIDSLGTDVIVLGHFTFTVDSSTQIYDNRKNMISFADLAVGMIVEIKGRRLADGTHLAMRIKIEDRVESEVEVSGPIDALTDSTISVNGREFAVVAHTVVYDQNKQKIDFGSLSTGQVVEVRGQLLPSGTLIAIRIKLEDNDTGTIEVQGPIDSLAQNMVMVLGLEFTVDAATVIEDKNDSTLTFDALQVGQTVEIKAVVQDDGTRLATRIHIEDVVVATGSASAVSNSSVVVAGTEFFFDATLIVLDANNTVVDQSALQSGQVLQVRATRQADNTTLATRISIENDVVVASVDETPGTLPGEFTLQQNYPNPFNPSTIIRFTISSVEQNSARVSLRIFNVLGQEVRTLLDNAPARAGAYELTWDGRDDSGRTLASGVYLYQLTVGSVAQTKRMVFMQ